MVVVNEKSADYASANLAASNTIWLGAKLEPGGSCQQKKTRTVLEVECSASALIPYDQALGRYLFGIFLIPTKFPVVVMCELL